MLIGCQNQLKTSPFAWQVYLYYSSWVAQIPDCLQLLSLQDFLTCFIIYFLMFLVVVFVWYQLCASILYSKQSRMFLS